MGRRVRVGLERRRDLDDERQQMYSDATPIAAGSIADVPPGRTRRAHRAVVGPCRVVCVLMTSSCADSGAHGGIPRSRSSTRWIRVITMMIASRTKAMAAARPYSESWKPAVYERKAGVRVVLAGRALAHHVHRVEDLPGADQPEGEHQEEHRPQRGKRDVAERLPRFAPSSRAASSSSAGDVLQRGEEDQHEGAGGGPHGQRDDGAHRDGRAGQPVPPGQAEEPVGASAGAGLSGSTMPTAPSTVHTRPWASVNHFGPDDARPTSAAR